MEGREVKETGHMCDIRQRVDSKVWRTVMKIYWNQGPHPSRHWILSNLATNTFPPARLDAIR